MREPGEILWIGASCTWFIQAKGSWLVAGCEEVGTRGGFRIKADIENRLKLRGSGSRGDRKLQGAGRRGLNVCKGRRGRNPGWTVGDQQKSETGCRRQPAAASGIPQLLARGDTAGMRSAAGEGAVSRNCSARMTQAF